MRGASCDMALQKSTAAGSLTKAVKLCRAAAPHSAKIEVEATTLAEVKEAVRAGAEVILLDNMTPALVRSAVAIIAGAQAALRGWGG